jgi:hypothetical protein
MRQWQEKSSWEHLSQAHPSQSKEHPSQSKEHPSQSKEHPSRKKEAEWWLTLREQTHHLPACYVHTSKNLQMLKAQQTQAQA